MVQSDRKGLADIAPRTARDRAFCDRWLMHFDHVRAYCEAGFRGAPRQISGRARAKLERFAKYLQPLQQEKARVVAERLVVSQDDVLQAMARVAFVNAKDYYVQTDLPVMHKVKDGAGVEGDAPLKVGGKVVYQVRAKKMDELTPEQLSAVEVRHDKRTGELTWSLPDLRSRTENRRALGQNLGMFLDKVILQNHTHHTNDLQLNVAAVPTDKLDALIAELLPAVGEDFARFLGFSTEEIAAASEGKAVTTEPGIGDA